MALDIVGHRGNGRVEGNPFADGKAPEHSEQSFRQAIDAGADGLEFDVFVTRDGTPVVHSKDEWCGKRLSGLFNEEVQRKPAPGGHKLLTLAELFALVDGVVSPRRRPLCLNIELKGPSVVEPTLAVFRHALKTTGLNKSDIVFFSGDQDKVSLMRELDPDPALRLQPSIRTNRCFFESDIQMPGYFVKPGISYRPGMLSEVKSYVAARGCDGIDMPLLDIRKDILDMAGDMGLGIATYPSGPRRQESVPLITENLRLLDAFARSGGHVLIKTDDIPVTRTVMDHIGDGLEPEPSMYERFMGLRFICPQELAA